MENKNSHFIRYWCVIEQEVLFGKVNIINGSVLSAFSLAVLTLLK